MAWRIIQQPNGLLARFSEIVDDFTDYDMSVEEAETLCRHEVGIGVLEAKEKVQRGLDAGLARFDEAIKIVRRVHGKMVAKERERELSQ